MTEIKKTPIPQRLKNVSNDHPYVAGAIDIIDDATGDNQQEINADTYRKNETYTQSQVDTKDGLLRVDIDENTENIRLIRQEITDVPVTSEVDPYPTANSTHPVMSGGVYQKNIQAEIVVGDPQGSWNPSTAEDMFERCQRQIELLNGSDVVITADHTGVVSPDTTKIYREPAQDGESYTDWMYDGSWHDMATYTFPGTDDEPTEDSLNIITSGTIYDYCAVAGTKVGEI